MWKQKKKKMMWSFHFYNAIAKYQNKIVERSLIILTAFSIVDTFLYILIQVQRKHFYEVLSSYIMILTNNFTTFSCAIKGMVRMNSSQEISVNKYRNEILLQIYLKFNGDLNISKFIVNSNKYLIPPWRID